MLVTASAAALIQGTGVADPIELTAFMKSRERPTASWANEEVFLDFCFDLSLADKTCRIADTVPELLSALTLNAIAGRR